MLIHPNRILIIKNLLPKQFDGLTIFPFIILKDKQEIDNHILIQHECIHLKQQLELLIIPFFIWYVIEFTYHFIKNKDSFHAYRCISFEKEAYTHEDTLNYLHNRKSYAFLKFLK
ncbi:MULTISPECIES: hypothetical protein [Myroides]|uniref:hypothetical protein n=1 Tax=Myroides TaxID=76831 RepID=UPI0018ACDE32|nr:MULTISPECIES: hypothetical protein [Myroides]